MSDDNRHITFLFAPRADARVKRISVHRHLIYLGGSALALLLALAIIGVIRFARHEALNLQYQALRSENNDLRQENHTLQGSYGKLKGQISYIEDMSKALAEEAQMERVPEVDEQAGAGGPEMVEALDKAADQLERNVRLIGDTLRADLVRRASVPSGFPVNGYITDGYGLRGNPFGGGRENHPGLDIAVDFGTPVAATADGIVIWAAPHGGYGNLVAVYHSNGITTRYVKLSKITVEPGQRLRRGDQIGHAGSTGRSTGPHVHYEIRLNDQPLDPMTYAGQTQP